MESLVLYSLLTSAAFYLGSRAKITQPLWSRYPKGFARFADCASCTGFWYGLFFGMALSWRPISLPVAGIPPGSWYAPLIIAMCSIVTTPIVAGLMQAGFERLGTAVPDEPEGGS
jgi:hypothetical protein